MADGNIVFKSAVINETNAGDKSIISAVANTILNVHALQMNATMAGTWRFEDGAAGTALTGISNMGADVEILLPFSEVPWFSTSSGNALSMELTGTGDIDGVMIYSEAS